ncbi:MAG: MerR family transcriptional regulator [Alphaproteobacteria bacterium]|nr:MerR family transcriptional regulator [Alphaproteobacteria bacterium]
MTKAATAFRTISEVSDDLNVPKHVLRFWEMKFPQIKPMKRGGGRRYYRPEDMALLKGICHLLHAEAYTIKGVQKILRERGVEAVKEMGETPSLPKKKPSPRSAKSAGQKTGRKPTATARKATASKNRPGRSGPTPTAEFGSDVVDAINRAISELKACRSALLGEASATKTRRKPRTARQAQN